VAETYQLHVITVPGISPARDANVALLESAGACVHAQSEPPSGTGLMRNWLTVLDCAIGTTVPWTVILQDDAELLPGWQRHLPRALAWSPRKLLALTYFGGYGKTVAEAGYAYGVGRHLVWGTAHATRTELLPALRTFADHCLTLMPDYPHDDNILALFGQRDGTALCARAIFGHMPGPSLVGHGAVSAKTTHRYPALTITGKGPPWSTPGWLPIQTTLSPPVTRLLIDRLGTTVR